MCPYEGMTDKIDCGPGRYSPLGAQECFTCKEGYECSNSNGISLTDYLTAPCLGNYCEIWSDGDYRTDACPLGHYCPSGSLFAIPCPIGTIRDTTGANLITDCADVTGGFFADKPGSYTDIISDNLC